MSKFSQTRKELIHDNLVTLLKSEKDASISADNSMWNTIGRMTFIGYNESNYINGKSPVFRTKKCSRADFNMIKVGSQVTITRKNKISSEDICENGTIIQIDKGLQSVVVKMQDPPDFVVAKSYKFQGAHLNTTVIPYWEKERHKENALFQSTIAGDDLLQEAMNAPLVDDADCDFDDEEPGLNEDGPSGSESVLNGVISKLTFDPNEVNEVFIDPPLLFDNDMNNSQKQAVRMALNVRRKIVTIQGPPGTGKTFTMSNLICEFLERKQTLLVVAPTNVAIENIYQAAEKRRRELEMDVCDNDLMTRDKFDEAVNSHSMIYVYNSYKEERAKHEKGSPEYNKLDKQLGNIWFGIRSKVLENTQVLFSTVSNSFAKNIKFMKKIAKVVIVDEAAQVKEAEVWPCIENMSRVIMAGDYQQLSAVVLEDSCRKGGLDMSLMQRLNDPYKAASKNSIMLDKQYRMNKIIMKWSSENFYSGRVKSDNDVKDISLFNYSHMSLEHKRQLSDERFYPMVLVDTGFEVDDKFKETYFESQTSSSSYVNHGEAELVVQHIINLLDRGVHYEHIAVITPYAPQKKLVTEKINAALMGTTREMCDIEVDTIDGFQGQERDVIIFSLVRNNPLGRIGFLDDSRRMNVAVTRAKRQFIMIGGGHMLKYNKREQMKNLYYIFTSQNAIVAPMWVRGESTFNTLKNKCVNLFGRNNEIYIRVCGNDDIAKEMKLGGKGKNKNGLTEGETSSGNDEKN